MLYAIYIIYCNISWYTTFLVYLPSLSGRKSFSIITLMLDIEHTRERATYNCPWEKTDCGRYNPTLPLNVWPCALLIDMAKARRTGNCRLLNIKGKVVSYGIRLKRGISTCCPT